MRGVILNNGDALKWERYKRMGKTKVLINGFVYLGLAMATAMSMYRIIDFYYGSNLFAEIYPVSINVLYTDLIRTIAIYFISGGITGFVLARRSWNALEGQSSNLEG